MIHSPGLNNREWIETLYGAWCSDLTDDSPGLNNREWIETRITGTRHRHHSNSPGLNNREWIETYSMPSLNSAVLILPV